jgi:CMP-N,N'-diacetyllegionaminic acid synthase
MIGAHKVLALIPARGGSKGLPRKNIAPIFGKPLIQWTIDAARESNYIDRLILSSDDDEIIAVATAGGCEAPFKRDKTLADDKASSIDVVLDALKYVPGYDICVLLQPTSPLRSSRDIDGAIELLHSSGASSCVTVRAAEEHPYFTFYADENGYLVHFVKPAAGAPTRRQDLPKAWCLNGAVYAVCIQWFQKNSSFISADTVFYPMPAERSIDIDTPKDMENLICVLENYTKFG